MNKKTKKIILISSVVMIALFLVGAFVDLPFTLFGYAGTIGTCTASVESSVKFDISGWQEDPNRSPVAYLYFGYEDGTYSSTTVDIVPYKSHRGRFEYAGQQWNFFIATLAPLNDAEVRNCIPQYKLDQQAP